MLKFAFVSDVGPSAEQELSSEMFSLNGTDILYIYNNMLGISLLN